MEFKETFANGYQIIVNGQEVGFFQFYIGDDELEEPIYLERIDISEAYRNQGYGTQALRQIAQEFGHIYFAADNENCQRLYERIADRCTLPNADYVDQGFGVYELR